MMTADDIRRSLECGRQSCPCAQRGSLCHCPAHNDGSPSLSVRDGQYAPLVTCQTGCSRESVIEALKALRIWPEREARPSSERTYEPVRAYRYVADDGRLVVEKGRFEWPDRETGEVKKRFNWRMPGAQRWGPLEDNLRVEDLPLFNLAGILQHPTAPVFFVEGEKAAEALIFRGLVAVALAGGASQRAFGSSLDWLEGREVILWPDHDAEGYALMGRLLFYLPQARLMRLQGALNKGDDAHDYFEAGGSLEGLSEALGEVVQRTTDMPRNGLRVVRPGRFGAA